MENPVFAMTCIPFPPVSVDVGALIGLVDQGSERRACVGYERTVSISQSAKAGPGILGACFYFKTHLCDPSEDNSARRIDHLEKDHAVRFSGRPGFLYAGDPPPLSGPTGPASPTTPSVRHPLASARSSALVGFSACAAPHYEPGDAHQ